ncbi:MAG TPA: PAS domain S-box protein [Prolixibacteraceae bacterium]|nr:PAS domain S-box protein [Prolixibacteraceae bacterium]
MKSISELKVKEISGWYVDELNDAQTILESNDLKFHVKEWFSSSSQSNDAKLRAALNQLVKEHDYKAITILTANFQQKISSGLNPEPFDSSTYALLRQVMTSGKALSTDLFRSTVDGRIGIEFIAPVLAADGTPFAFAIFKHDPERFLFPLIENWPVISRSSETLLVRREGETVLYLNNLRHLPNAALNLTIPLSRKDVPAVKAVQGFSGVTDGLDYREVKVLSYVGKVPGTPWFIVSKIDYQELNNSFLFRSGTPILIFIVLVLVFGLFFYIFYINQQKNIFKRLYSSEQEFRATLYSIGDAVIIADKTGRVMNMNPVAENLTGYGEREAIGKPVEEVFVIVSEENHQSVESPVKQVMEKGAVVGLANHTLLISKQGDEIPISDSGAPIFDKDQHIIGVVLVFRDQTVERQQQKVIFEGQREMATLLSNLTGMVYRCRDDADWTMEYVSKGCEELTGYQVKELENNFMLTYEKVIHPDDQAKVRENVEVALKEKTFFQIEYRIVAKDQTIKWVWDRGLGVFDENGSLVSIEGFISDITNRKKTEEALRSSEILFETLAENVSVGIFRTDDKGMTTYVNPMWCQLAGMDAEQAMGYGWLAHVHPDDKDSLLADWKKNSGGHARVVAEYRFVHRDGKVLWVKGHAIPEFNEKGELIGYIGSITDVTESILSAESMFNTNQLLRTFIDNIPDAVYLKDTEGKKLIANKADVENCGFNSEEEIIGKSDFDIFSKDVAERFWEDDQRVLQSGIPVLVREEKLENFKKEVKWLLTSKIPLKDSAGKIIGLVGIGRDITQRKKREDEMLKLTKAIAQSPVSIVITNKKGVIEYVNPKFSEITGYSSEEAVGQNPRILKSGKQNKEFYKEMWDTILSGKDWKAEFLNKKKNGELYWENANISPVLNDKGQIINFIAIKEDVSEKKKMLEELIVAKEKAEESDKLKSSFLANMSHEIRTPLNSILGFSNFLTSEEDLSADEKKEYSNIINKSAESLLQIINDIIDISSLETGQLKTFYSYLNVNGILKSIHTVFSLKLVEINKSHLVLTLLEKEGLVVYADENRFIQVLTNLLNNAVKFTMRGEIGFGVEHFDEEMVWFIVYDTGIGIKPEVQTTIFERFRQGEEDTTRNFGGNGLGLSIVKNLVELMGGKITLESEPGVGSKFRFSLPRKAPKS